MVKSAGGRPRDLMLPAATDTLRLPRCRPGFIPGHCDRGTSSRNHALCANLPQPNFAKKTLIHQRRLKNWVMT